MWFLWKMRPRNCEFREKWYFQNVNFWINWGFLSQCELWPKIITSIPSAMTPSKVWSLISLIGVSLISRILTVNSWNRLPYNFSMLQFSIVNVWTKVLTCLNPTESDAMLVLLHLMYTPSSLPLKHWQGYKGLAGQSYLGGGSTHWPQVGPKNATTKTKMDHISAVDLSWPWFSSLETGSQLHPSF